MAKVGIPRGLFYYQYFPLWKAFFEELGAEVVTSEPSNRQILDAGLKSCVDEACLPVKLYHGHVLNLKGRVDFLFIPRLTSVSKNEYICPKFGGLPDMIRNSVKDLPGLIDTEVNLRKSKGNALKAAIDIGSCLCDDRRIIKRAFENALRAYRKHKDIFLRGQVPCLFRERDGFSGREGREEGDSPGRSLNIALIGHPYNVYDSFVNMGLLSKLTGHGVNFITVDMLAEDAVNRKAAALNKPVFWNFARKAVGGVLHLLDRDDLDGIIYLMSFGCGVDSFICDLIERKVRRLRDIPFAVLTIDEHTGEAGMNTRLEAFIDMLRWRELNENNLSSHG